MYSEDTDGLVNISIHRFIIVTKLTEQLDPKFMMVTSSIRPTNVLKRHLTFFCTISGITDKLKTQTAYVYSKWEYTPIVLNDGDVKFQCQKETQILNLVRASRPALGSIKFHT